MTHEQDSFKRPKIVFLLLISGRSYIQVLRLLKNIYSDQHYYFIHVDFVIFYLKSFFFPYSFLSIFLEEQIFIRKIKIFIRKVCQHKIRKKSLCFDLGWFKPLDNNFELHQGCFQHQFMETGLGLHIKFE